MVIKLPPRFYELKKIVSPYTDEMGRLKPDAPIDVQLAKREMVEIAKREQEF